MCFPSNQKSNAHFQIGAVATNQALQVPKYLSRSQPVWGQEGFSSIMKLYEMVILASQKYEALFQRRAHNGRNLKQVGQNLHVDFDRIVKFS